MDTTEAIAPEALSDLIGAIYDCALEPERWQQTQQQINAFCDSPFGGLGINDSRTGYIGVYQHGYSPDFIANYPAYASLNPIFDAASLKAVGEVNTQAMLFDQAEFLETRYYRECLSRFGYRDLIGFIGLKSGSRVAFLHAGRYDHQPSYGEREIGRMRLLVPHICRALKISDALDLRTITSAMLESTLNTLAAGVFLLDGQGRVVYTNTAGERLLRRSQALHVVQGRLRAREPGAQQALERTLESLASDGETISTTIALGNGADPGFVASILPIDRGQRRGVFAPFAAAAAMFVQDPEVAPLMPGEAFAKLYGLTAGELRVLLAMAPGLGLTEAADMLGIGESTARTHLQRIFAKTGTSKQVELTRLLMSSTPPVAAR